MCLVATTRCQYWDKLGLQVNEFEQVSSDDHQMPDVGGGGRSPGLMLWGWSPARSDALRGRGSTLPCNLSHDTCDLPTPLPWTDRCRWKHYLPATSFTGGNKPFYSINKKEEWKPKCRNAMWTLSWINCFDFHDVPNMYGFGLHFYSVKLWKIPSYLLPSFSEFNCKVW